MSTIIAIFSDMKSLEDAQAALRAAGHDDAVRRVVDQSSVPNDDGAAAVVAGAHREAGLLDLGAAGPGASFLDGLDLPEGEAGFVQDALADGARVLLLDAEDGAAVREAVRPHAQRIVPGL